MAEALSSASAKPRARLRRCREVSTLWWLASTLRSSAINAPKASDSITACAWSVVRPLLLTRARPAVVLGSGDDGFVFGGELSDRTPLFLFDGDGLVRGQLRTHMLKHPKQHRPAGDVGGVARMRLCSFVGPVEDHVGAVSVLAAGHRDIEVLPRARRLDQDVRRVDGDALRPVCGAGVAEVDVLSHVVGQQDDTVAEPAPGGRIVTDPSDRVISRPGLSVPSRMRSARTLRAVTFSWVSAINTDATSCRRLRRQAMWAASVRASASPSWMRLWSR